MAALNKGLDDLRAKLQAGDTGDLTEAEINLLPRLAAINR